MYKVWSKLPMPLQIVFLNLISWLFFVSFESLMPEMRLQAFSLLLVLSAAFGASLLPDTLLKAISHAALATLSMALLLATYVRLTGFRAGGAIGNPAPAAETIAVFAGLYVGVLFFVYAIERIISGLKPKFQRDN